MQFLRSMAGEDRLAQGILALSLAFGLIYLFDDFGLGAPYPMDVLLKSAGIHLLAAFALHRGAPVLALGLFLGAWGDIFLALQPEQLAAGIGAFGLGHIVYIGLFAQRLKRDGLSGPTGWIAAALLAVFGAAMLVYLHPHFGELRIAASIYNGIILAMAILAVIGRAHPIAIFGALLFVISDSVLAMRIFAGQLDWADWVVWVTYYSGQAGIAVGLAKK